MLVYGPSCTTAPVLEAVGSAGLGSLSASWCKGAVTVFQMDSAALHARHRRRQRLPSAHGFAAVLGVPRRRRICCVLRSLANARRPAEMPFDEAILGFLFFGWSKSGDQHQKYPGHKHENARIASVRSDFNPNREAIQLVCPTAPDRPKTTDGQDQARHRMDEFIFERLYQSPAFDLPARSSINKYARSALIEVKARARYRTRPLLADAQTRPSISTSLSAPGGQSEHTRGAARGSIFCADIETNRLAVDERTRAKPIASNVD